MMTFWLGLRRACGARLRILVMVRPMWRSMVSGARVSAARPATVWPFMAANARTNRCGCIVFSCSVSQQLFDFGPGDVLPDFAGLQVDLGDGQAGVGQVLLDDERVVASLAAEHGGGVAQGVGGDLGRVDADADGALADDLIDHAGGVVGEGGPDVVVGADGVEAAGGAQVIEDGLVGGHGELVAPGLAAFAVPAVSGSTALEGDVGPFEVDDLAGAAAGVEVGQNQGVISAAAQGAAVDFVEQGAGLLGAEGVGFFVGRCRRSRDGVGGVVVVERDLEAAGVDDGEYGGAVGVIAADGGEAGVDCGIGEVLAGVALALGDDVGVEVLLPGGDVGFADLPGPDESAAVLRQEADEEVVPCVLVGADGGGGAGFALFGGEPVGAGAEPEVEAMVEGVRVIVGEYGGL